PGKLSETDQTKLESKAAAAYFALRRFPEALDVYERLLSRDRLADVADLHLVYERIGDCLEKVGREQEAFAYYRRGRSYSKAVRLAEQLGLPRAEVLKLKIRGARDRKDFDSALRFAAETKNPRLVAEIRGQRNEHLGQHQAAVDDFIEAGRWSKAIRSIRLAKLAFTEEYAAKCKLLVAVALAEGVPKRSDKEQIMRVARQVQEDPVWERYVSPQEMGLVYEKCATRAEAAMYYKTKIPESDSSEG
ncbi:MAG: hypothetical protein ACE5IJ_11030, partial [Thermoplasmata archaeon]